METRKIPGVVRARQNPSETSLEGWKLGAAGTQRSKSTASETSLEGWKLADVYDRVAEGKPLPKLP